MNINIAIGQYYPADSPVHRLDPRIKLLGTFVFIIMLFFCNSFWGYAFAAVCLAGVIGLSNVPPKFMFKGLRAILYVIVFTVFLNIFFVPGQQVLFSVWKIKVTLEGLFAAGRMGSRLILLIVGSSVLTLTTSPIELTDGIEFSLKPLKPLGVSGHEIAMMMTIALRFIPTLMEEVDKIMKAQMARGADFDTGNLYQKAKSMIPLLVPLFISAFSRAEDLAMAMEARCYRGDIDRTRMKALKLKGRDYGALALFAGFIGGIIVIRILV